MKCLIFSDSHGNTSYMEKAIRKNSDADYIFFLGDGISDAEALAEFDRNHTWVCVKGNCDFKTMFLGRALAKTEEIFIENKKVVLTHGDLYNVKYGLENIKSLARSRKADIVLFGHTHRMYEEYVSESMPFYLFNPGSISKEDYSFGILTVTGNTVLLSFGRV